MSLDVKQEMQKQTNQAAIDCGQKAIGSLFILNGAAVTTLLAQRKPYRP